MDAERFDTWTTALSAGTGSRRDALRLLAGGALASLLAHLTPDGVGAQAAIR